MAATSKLILYDPGSEAEIISPVSGNNCNVAILCATEFLIIGVKLEEFLG